MRFLAQVPPPSTQPVPALDPVQWITLATLIAAPLILILLWASGAIRPAALKITARQVAAHPSWVWMGSALLLWLSIQFGAALAASALGVSPGSRSIRDDATVMLAYSAVGLIAAVVLARLLNQPSPAGLTFRPKDLLTGLGLFLLAYPVVALISRAAVFVVHQITGSPPPDLSHDTLTKLVENRDNPWAWTMAGCAVIAAPIVEEVLYRGLVQSALLRLTSSPLLAVLLTSAAFTAAHIPAVPNHALPTLFVLSLALGLAFERTGRLGVAIVMHALFNALNLALAMML